QYNGTVPVAAFTAPSPVCQGAAVQLDAATSSTGVSPIVDYRFEVLDGGVVVRTVNGSNPIQQFTFPVLSTSKTYQVQLTVTTAAGCTNTSTVQDITVNPMPDAIATVKEPNVCAVAGKIVDLTNWVMITNNVAGTVTYSGTGVTGTTFDPNTPGLVMDGANTINYLVTGNDGSCTTSGSFVINVRPLPIITTQPLGQTICAGGTTTLSVTTSVTSGSLYYQWYEQTLGKLSGQTGSSLVVNTPGIYYVEVMSDFACPITSSTASVIINPIPEAKFEVPSSCSSVSGTVFDASASTVVAPANIARYIWNFGDGNTATVTTPTVTHAYTAVGQYNVTLTVETDQTPSCSNPTTQMYNFVGTSPVVDFNITNNAICSQDSIHLQSTATVAVGTIKTYDWQFFESGKRIGVLVKNLPDVYATFPKDSVDRNYEVKLVITTEGGCVDSSALKPFTIKALPKIAINITNKEVCFTPGLITINVTPATGGVLTGAGIVAGTNQFDPMVAGVGKHGIRFTYTDPVTTCINSITDTITVRPLPSPTITASSDETCQNETIKLKTELAAFYQWFKNGSIITGATDSILNVSEVGTFDYTVAVTNVYGCMQLSSPYTITIWPKPVAAFTVPANCSVVDTATFINNSTISNLSPLTYKWSFGEPDNLNNTYTAKDGKYQYDRPGKKQVKLIVTSINGCVDSLTKEFIMLGTKPKADFYFKGKANACAGDSLVMRDTSINKIGVAYDFTWAIYDGPTNLNLTIDKRNQVSIYLDPAWAGKTLTAKMKLVTEYGCADSTSKPFQVFAKPTVSLNIPQDTVCINVPAFPLTGGAPGPGIYSMLNGGKGIYKSTFYPDSAGAGIHEIMYTYTDPLTGCSTSKLDTITVFDLPTVKISASSSTQFCKGDSVVLKASPLAYRFQWRKNNVDIAGATKDTFVALDSARYSVIAYNQGGCTATDSINVTVWAKPIAAFVSPSDCVIDVTTFVNNSTIADGSVLTYLWDFGDGTTSTSKVGVHQYKTAGTKTVTLTVKSPHCEDKQIHTFDINAQPQADFVIKSQQPYCVNDGLIFEDRSTIAFGAITTWKWQFFEGGVDITNNVVIENNGTKRIIAHMPSSTTPKNYMARLTVYSAGTCFTIKDQLFTVNPNPIASLAPFAPVCLNQDQVVLTGGMGVSGFVVGKGFYSGAGVVDNIFKPYMVGPGVQKIYYTFTNEYNCADVKSQDIVVNDLPVIDCKDFDVLIGNSINLNVALKSSESKSYTYQWSPGTGLSDPTIADPTLTPSADMDYTVTVTNAEGCISQCHVHVNVLPNINPPNAFTPNGDGKNDYWEIPGAEKYPNAEVYVFNRYGEKIFYSNGYSENQRWDGRVDGKPVPTATYYFIFKPNKDQLKPFAGGVTVMY
ncbi:PKD domain-containing protein, partial [Solitalea koreensis]